MALSALGFVRRPLLWMSLSFLAAIAVGLLFPGWIALPCSTGIALLFFWLSQGSRRSFLPLVLLAAFLGLAVLLLHQGLRSAFLSPLLLPEKTLTVTMTVEEAVQRGAYRRYTGHALLTDGEHTAQAEITVTGFVETSFSPGEALHCEASLPTETNQSRASVSDPIRLYLTKILPGDPSKPPHPIRAGLVRWRSSLSERVAAFAPGETGAVLCAMLTGDQTRLSPESNAAFRRSGLSHILVVSGMHLVILCAMLSLLLAPLDARLQALLILLFSWGFAFLTGAGNSILRAAVMMTLAQLGPLCKRKSDTLTSLGVAGVLMAAQNPAALLTASFGLSFGAVAGLALLEKPFRRLLEGSHPSALRGRLCANLAAGLAAQVGAAPTLLVTFGLFPLLGILANLLVVELIAPLMALGLLALLSTFFAPFLSDLLFSSAQGLAFLLLKTAQVFSTLPFAQVGISARWQAVGLLGLFLLAIWLLAHRPGKAAVRLALLGWCAVFLTVSVNATLASRSFASVLIQEGGVAVVIQGKRAVLFGAPTDLWQADKLSDAMIRLGVRQIDGVMLATSESAELPLIRLLDRFDGARRVAAADLPITRRFCDGAGVILCKPPQNTVLFGGATVIHEENGWRISFSGATLLKSGANCAIIGRYSQALSLGEEILHCRVRLEDTDDSAK